MPFVFDALLRRIGLKATLLAWAGASAAMTLPTLVFIKPRTPLHNQAQVQPLSFRFLRHTSFWMMQAGVIIQSLGYLMPSTYLASYASTIGLPSITGPILLALFSVASVPGGIVHGMLGDKFSATKAVTIASIGSALHDLKSSPFRTSYSTTFRNICKFTNCRRPFRFHRHRTIAIISITAPYGP